MSRRAAEEAIRAGRVTVNGHTAVLGESAVPDIDEIRVDGRLLREQSEKVYILLHKPRGVVTTMSDEKGRKSVADLVHIPNVRVFPVGRLDLDSEGLLLLTNDGDFAQRLTHPSHEVEKCYRVWVRGEDLENAPARLAAPMRIDGYPIRPAFVRLVRLLNQREALLSVTIHEGRNRQVRKMCEAVGLRVTRLVRVSEGGVKLGDLPSGQWRYLSKDEIHSLL